jgi:hypothetical protein
VARRTRLIPPTRFTALLVLVLLLHALALQWLAQQLDAQRSALHAMAAPMFTRLLQPETPAAVPAAAPPPAAAKPKRSGITSIAKSQAAAAARAASEPVESEQPEQQPSGAEVSGFELPGPSVPRDITATASTPSVTTPGTPARDSTPAASTPEGTPTAAAPASAAASSTGSSASTASLAPSTVSPPASAASSASPGAERANALASWPADTRLTYHLGGYFRGELHGDARVQWQRQDDRYQARVEIDLTLLASVTMTSQGEVTPKGLVPRVYEELRRSGPRTARLRDNTITLNDGRTLPRPDGVQDTASQFVELSHRFSTGQEALEVGRSVSLWMARPGGLDLWTYDIVEREILQTPAFGPLEAFRLKPRPIANPRGNYTAEIWFAPSLQYLPVRIRVNMGESAYVDLLVEKIEQR